MKGTVGAALAAAFLVSGCGGTEPGPQLVADADSIVFSGFVTSPNPVSLQLSSTGGTGAWSASSSVPWLLLLPPTGVSLPASLVLSGRPDGLTGGSRTGVVQVQSAGLRDLVIPVRMDVPSLTGDWTGTLPSGGGGGATAAVAVTLTDGAGGVTGSGTISGTVGSVPVTITGQHSHPVTSLTLTVPGFQPFVMAGVFTAASTVAGTLTGSGFNGEAFVLTHP